jgi:hypothetical protein
VRAVCDQFLDCPHCLDYTSLDVRKGLVCVLSADLREHEIFEVTKKPFPTNALHIGWRIDVDGHIGQMFV